MKQDFSEAEADEEDAAEATKGEENEVFTYIHTYIHKLFRTPLHGILAMYVCTVYVCVLYHYSMRRTGSRKRESKQRLRIHITMKIMRKKEIARWR